MVETEKEKMRKTNMFAALAVSILSAFFGTTAAGQEEFPFRVNKVSDRVTVFQARNYMEDACVTVITTKKGLIIVDTGGYPTLAERYKRKIKDVLGRDDFLYVINTHDHIDHTGGNQAFAGAVIVGHENAVPVIKRMSADKDQLYTPWRNAIYRGEMALKAMDPKSEKALSQAELVRWFQELIGDQGRFIPTPPTKTFSDRLTLQVDDLNLKLYYFGRAHSDNDILIHVPELGVLFVGDLFNSSRLSALISPELSPEVPRGLKVLGEVLKNKGDIQTVIGGHAHIFSLEWMTLQYRYMRDLWEAITSAKKDGMNLQAFQEKNALDKKFAYAQKFFDLNSREVRDGHQSNVEKFWRVGQKSAAKDIEQTLDALGVEAARKRFEKLRSKEVEAFYLDEREMNALGYRLMQNGKMPEAIAVFEMNTVAFPQSWNVWDSLAEAHMNSGDNEKAEIYYEKSLGLNPDNINGKNNLSQLRGYKSDAQGETKEAAGFKPGDKTGLQGPYLGQTPPGLKPKVFAPGIVSTAGNFEFAITFSPDGKEVYFTRRPDGGGQNTIMMSHWEKDGWSAPEEAAFCKGFPSNEPHVTPDGNRLYFGCNRQQPGADRAEYGIWVTERTTGGGWGEPRYHGPGMYVSAGRKGHLYMTDVTMVAGGGLIRYPFAGGTFGRPEKLPTLLNEPTPIAHGFIAADESFLVFDSYNRPGGQGGEGDLWVSFKKVDGTWAEPANLGDTVNTPATNFCPSLSPDGKFLFFSTCRDITWVSAEVIERLRPKEVGPAQAAFDPQKKYPAEALKEDLKVLWDMLEEGHGGFDRYTPASMLKKSFDEAMKGLTGPLTEFDFYLRLLPLIAEVKDGHTRAQISPPAGAFLDDQPIVIPVGLRFLGGKACIFRNLSEDRGIQEGAELLTINAMPVGEILSKLLPLIPNDAGIQTRKLRQLEYPATFGRLFALRFGRPDSYRIRLRLYQSKDVQEITVPGIKGKDVVRILYERYPDAATRRPLYELSFRGTAAILTIRGFGDDPGKGSLPYPEFLNNAFRTLEEKKTPNLIIDLRGNGGGRDEYGKLLFAHVMDRPFLYYKALETKKDHYDLFRFTDESPKDVEDLAKQVKQNGRGWFDVLAHPNSGLQQPENPGFIGRVAILLDGLSFSATGETTSLFHFYKKAVFFGEECGAGYYGNTSGFMVMATLPNTRIQIRIPLVLYTVAVDGYPKDRGIVPEVPVSPTIEDLLTGRDPVLERALQYLEKKEIQPGRRIP